MDTRELIEQAKNKDEHAVDELINLTKKKLYYTVLKLVNEAVAADEIIQQTYIFAFQHLDQLQDPDQLDSWLAKIAAKNAKIDLEKKSGKFSELDNTDGDLSFEESLEGKTEVFYPEETNYEEIIKGLDSLLDKMPAQTRMALILFYYQNLTIQEIADIQGVSDRTIEALLASGRNIIKDRIEQMRKKDSSF